MENVASQVFIPLTVGGGIRSVSDIRTFINSGADKITKYSCYKNPNLVSDASEAVGSQCIVVAIDAKRKKFLLKRKLGDIHSWRKKCTGIDALKWAEEMEIRGAGELL